MTSKKVIHIEEFHSGNILAVPYGSDIRTLEQRKQQQKRQKMLTLRKRDERGNFVILNLLYLERKLKQVGYIEMGYAMMLLPYAAYPKEGEKYLPLGTEAESVTYEKLSEIWGVQPDTVRKIVKRLVDKRILISITDKLDKRKKVVHLSKRLVFKGKIPKSYLLYTKVYQNQLLIGIVLMSNLADTAKAMGLFALSLIKLNGDSQILLEDDEKADTLLEGENIVDFFSRLRIASKNTTTITKIKDFLGISDNRSIKKSLALLQQVGMLNQVTVGKKKVYMVNPTCASKQDSSKTALYYFVLNEFFENAMVSSLLKYQSITTDEKKDNNMGG